MSRPSELAEASTAEAPTPIRGVDWMAPFEPDASHPFDLAAAGHLTDRIALGASLTERRRLVDMGVEAAVPRVLGPLDPGHPDRAARIAAALQSRERVQQHRMLQLLEAKRPLLNRMTLFWHDHFATSDAKVNDPQQMAMQLATFDRHGLGRFDDLLLAVAQDPAMLRWLDNDTNLKGAPNENFARELFELFALGRGGGYTEDDIREAARAFTGWRTRDGRFHLDGRRHDRGEKTVLGKTGNLEGEHVVQLAVQHPDSPGFLARKWLQEFVHPAPPPEEVAALAEVYRKQDRHVGRTLLVLFQSRLFFSARARRSRIKSPIEFVVCTIRRLGARCAPAFAERAAARIGQAWLEPPSVEGWPRHTAWLNSATWRLRNRFAARLSQGYGNLRPKPDALLERLRTPEARVELVANMLLDGQLTDGERERLLAIAKDPVSEGPGGPGFLCHAALSLPQVQRI